MAGRGGRTRRAGVRLLAAAAAALATVGLLFAPPAAAADPGTIVVTVTAADTGGPVVGVCATASDPNSEAGAVACVEPGGTGQLVLSGLTDGLTYNLSVSVPPSTGYFGIGGPFFRQVTAPADLAFTLQPGVFVEGSLSFQDGTTPESGQVFLEPVDTSLPAASTFFFAGTWSTIVQAGDYRVHFRDSASGYEQYAFGAASVDQASVVTAAHGQPLRVDDVLLQGGGGGPAPALVSGRVTDAATGAPLEGICVLTGFPNDPPPQTSSCPDVGSQAPTAADGTYTVETGDGDWDVWFLDLSGAYAATSVRVTAAAGTTATADAALVAAGQVSGVAVDARTGAPLQGLCPNAYSGRTTTLVGRIVCSDATGRWSVRGITPGQVTVLVPGDTTHVDRWVPGVDTQAEAKLLTVVARRTLDVGTVKLPHGAVLSGRITDTRGRPVEGAWVVVGRFNPDAGAGEGRWTARTGADGRYSIPNVGLAPDVATVYAPGLPLAWQFSGGASDPADATLLRFRSEKTTRFDAVLAPEARLTVRVHGAAPDSFSQVSARTRSGAFVGWSAFVVGDGEGTVAGLPTSRVKVVVTVEGRTLWWAGGRALSADPAAAATAAVRSGRTSAIDVDLLP